MLHRNLHPTGGALSGRWFDDERYAQRFVVHQQAVCALAVIAEAFSVGRDEDDGGLVVELVRLEVADEPGDRFIDRRDFAVVRRQLIRSVGFGIWRMGTIKMQEQERALGPD